MAGGEFRYAVRCDRATPSGPQRFSATLVLDRHGLTVRRRLGAKLFYPWSTVRGAQLATDDVVVTDAVATGGGLLWDLLTPWWYGGGQGTAILGGDRTKRYEVLQLLLPDGPMNLRIKHHAAAKAHEELQRWLALAGRPEGPGPGPAPGPAPGSPLPPGW